MLQKDRHSQIEIGLVTLVLVTGICVQQTSASSPHLFSRRWVESLGWQDGSESHSVSERDGLLGVAWESKAPAYRWGLCSALALRIGNDSKKEVSVLTLSLLSNKNVKYVEVHTSN